MYNISFGYILTAVYEGSTKEPKSSPIFGEMEHVQIAWKYIAKNDVHHYTFYSPWENLVILNVFIYVTIVDNGIRFTSVQPESIKKSF